MDEKQFGVPRPTQGELAAHPNTDWDKLAVENLSRRRPDLVYKPPNPTGDSFEMWLNAHAAQLAQLLRSEWEVPGYVRSWHVRYQDTEGNACQASVSQQKGVEGFHVAMVRNGYFQGEHSGLHLNLRAACIWLGLDTVEPPLDWRIEL